MTPVFICSQLVNEQQESRPLLSPSIDDFLCETKSEAIARPVTSNTAGNSFTFNWSSGRVHFHWRKIHGFFPQCILTGEKCLQPTKTLQHLLVTISQWVTFHYAVRNGHVYRYSTRPVLLNISMPLLATNDFSVRIFVFTSHLRSHHIRKSLKQKHLFQSKGFQVLPGNMLSDKSRVK